MTDQLPEEKNHNLARLEALLFIHGEPITFKKIGDILGLSSEAAQELAKELEQKLEGADRGLAVVSSAEKIQLVTKGEFSKIVESFVKSELSEELSPASLETLAVIAYFGPLSRARIDYQRGVNSTFILRSLLLRGLVERFSDPAHPNSYLYAPSFEFLKYVGVKRQEELPSFEKFKSLLSRFEAGEGKVEATPSADGLTERGT